MSEHDGPQTQTEQRRPDSIDEMFPGRFLRAVDLGGREQTVTIVDVWAEDLEGQKGVKPKAVLAFERKSPGPRELVLAKINSVAIKAMFGDTRKAWLGKRITLYATDKLMPMPLAKGERGPVKPCIRIAGSPDITEEIPVTFAPPRRRAVHMIMKPTGRRGGQRAPEPPREEPPPSSEPEGRQPGDD